MDTLAYIIDKYSLTLSRRPPNEIPGQNREDLARLFCELGFKVGAEIGTERGRYAQILCRSNPGVKLYCVDAWKIYDGYRCRSHIGHGEQQRVDDHLSEAKSRLKDYDVEYIRKFSMDALSDFADNSLDFVYIDANHDWAYISQDLFYWEQKVRPGGIISGHDYMKPHIRGWLSHVAPAVFGYTWSYNINPWFVMGTQAETDHLSHGRARSFFWVKK